MFNPYHARPIGSEKFEKHLLTLMVEGFYTKQAAREAIPEYPVVPRAMPGESSWQMDPVDRCWNDLNTAILSLALIDYLDAYAKKLEAADRLSPREWVYFSQCAVIENEYLRMDEDRAALLDAILSEIHSYYHLQNKLAVIRRIKSRISSQGRLERKREKRMRDQAALAQECLEVEMRRESVLDFLKGKGFISPAATWQRLQLNYLERQPNKLTKGNGDIMGRKITLDQKEKAVMLAIEGGDPIGFLQECGSKNPVNMWNVIKMTLKQKDPETFTKIPDQRKNGAKKRNEKKDEPTVEPEEAEPFHVEDIGEDEPAILTARVATEDTVHVHVKKITKPVNYDGFDVCGVRGKFGKYSFSDINGKNWLDFDDPSGDTLSYPVEDWKDFLAELRKAAAVLGVEL